jgi:Family of unknown function (DUF6290)
MLTVRLDDRLDKLTKKAAAMEGASVSEFMRRAISERAERTLAGGTQERLRDVLGAIHGGGGGHARDTGGAFTELLTQRRKRS